MLVLTRKASEQIIIGDDITITVVRIDGNKVRLGIHAPSTVSIRRQELPPRPELNGSRPASSSDKR